MDFDRNIPGFLVLLTSLTIAAVVVLGPVSAQPERFVAKDHPAAVLAWASLRCDPSLELSLRAARVQAEDLRTVAAAFDVAAHYRPLKDLCAEAMEISAPVTRIVASDPARHEPLGQTARATVSLLASISMTSSP